ncbi:MAG: AEC family transporter [Halanaerobiaceae bacterium]
MELSIIINQILVLFLMILIGFIIRKQNIITDDIKKGFSKILILITMPALIIKSILSIELNQEIITNIGLMTLISFLSYLFVIIISSPIAKKLNCSTKKKNVFKFLLIFGNVGYMGIPVVSAIFPEEAVVYTIINNIIFNVYLWTYGIQIFSMDKSNKTKIQWKKLINPGTIALFTGFFLLATNIKLGPVHGTLEIMGEMTFPLSMLIIGSSLTNVSLKKILTDKYLYYVLFLKLLIIPLAALFLIKQFSLPVMVASIGVIMLAMPSGAITVIFAEKFDSDYTFASEGIFFTTLLSLFSIPFFIWLIKLTLGL